MAEVYNKNSARSNLPTHPDAHAAAAGGKRARGYIKYEEARACSSSRIELGAPVRMDVNGHYGGTLR